MFFFGGVLITACDSRLLGATGGLGGSRALRGSLGVTPTHDIFHSFSIDRIYWPKIHPKKCP